MRRVGAILISVLLVLFFMVPSVSAEELKVVTLNIWSGLDYEGVWKFGEYESDDIREARYEKQLEILRCPSH